MKIRTRYGYLEKAKSAKVGEREFEVELGPHDVLVRNLGNNLCTTDWQQWLGLREHQGYPMAGGHENEMEVLDVGSEVVNVVAGDKVSSAYPYCGVCENCRAGYTFACTGVDTELRHLITEDGILGPFGMSQYRVVEDRLLYVMNPELEPCEAGFLEPIGTVCCGIRRLRVANHEKILVIGAGTMGLANAQVARAFGARVAVSEVLENKLEAARGAGFEVIDAANENVEERAREITGGTGFDAVILAVSNKAAIEQAFACVKELYGRILFFAAGYPAPDVALDSNMIHYRQMEFIGTAGGDVQDFSTAAMLLNTRAIDVKPMCEPVQFDLDDIQAAFESAATPGRYRVHVRVPEGDLQLG